MCGEVSTKLFVISNIASLAPGVQDGGHAARWRLLDRVDEEGRVGAGVCAAKCSPPGGSTRPDVRPTTMSTAATASWPTIMSVAVLTPRSLVVTIHSISTPPPVRSLCVSAAAQKALAAAFNTHFVQYTDRFEG